MGDNHCYLCKVQPPTFICFCEEVRVCQSCISYHLLDNPSTAHKPVPLNSQELISFLRSETKLPEKCQSLAPDSKRERREKERALLQHEIERLTGFQTEALLNLQNVRLEMERQIAMTMEEVGMGLKSRAETILSKLQQRLLDLDDSAPSADDHNSLFSCDELLRISLEVREIDLTSIIKNSMKVVMEVKELTEAKPQPTVMYKVFGGSNSVGVFDGKREKHEKTLTASIKFYHNACSCESPTSLIYITGGSLTGRSRNEVFLFTPSTSQVRELQSMQIARRSHASLFCSSYLYVFGGLLDEERISLCERYKPESDSWEAISQMKERRAYLSACEFKGKIYVGGGGERSSCEVYDPRKDLFELVLVEHIAIEDNCSMMPLSSSILIFHGNFRGDVTSYDPATQKFTREKEMCVGNSWSPCPPVLVGNTIYMLRSDSVFKYDIESGVSEYVLRMAKIVKKRLTLDP